MLRFVPKHEEKQNIPGELLQLGLPERLLELLIDRGLNTPKLIDEYLHPDKHLLYDPMRMQGMDRAVAVIRDSIAKGEEIIVFGDYDVDGVTATAILLTYLRKQGAKVGFYIRSLEENMEVTARREAVLQVLSTNDNLTLQDIAVKTNQDIRTTQAILTVLKKYGKIESVYTEQGKLWRVV